MLLGSPGPAPLALAASGAIFGFRSSIPFLVGILIGLAVIIVASIAGINLLFEAHPRLRFTLQVVGGLYILYIAFKLASAPIQTNGVDHRTLPSLLNGVILNITNPKAYAAIFALFTQFSLPIASQLTSYLLTGLVCFTIAVIIDTAWLIAGHPLRQLFSHKTYARPVRIIFAAMMILAVGLSLYSGK